MGVLGDVILALAAMAVVIAAPLEFAFAVLVGVWLLVPSNLSVPHAPHILLLNSMVLYAFVFRLLVRRGPDEPAPGAFKPTPMHVALLALVLVAFFDGVIFVPNSDSLAQDIHSWFNDLNVLILFVVVLAVIRTISAWRAATVIVSVFAASVGIGIVEHFTHHGWSNFFFEHLPANYINYGAGPLQTRSGHVRSQGAAQFALEYGWAIAMLLPLMIVVIIHWPGARRGWGRLVNALPFLAVVTVIFSGSRSALVAAVAAVALMVIMVGFNRRMAVWGAAAALVGALTAVADPSLITSLFSSGKTDPASVRLDRLPPLFALVVHHPFTGLGLTGISSYFGGLDDAYAILYATLGVLGVLAWLALLATALATTARAFRARSGSEARMLGAACFAGICAAAVAGASYDFTNTLQSLWTLTMLAALGVAVADTAPRPERARRSRVRVLMPLVGALLGLVVYAFAPVSSSESLSVVPIAPWVLVVEDAFYPNQGTELVHTLCPIVTNPDTIAPHTSVSCLQDSTVFPLAFPALAVIDVRAPTAAAVRQEADRAVAPISRSMPMETSTIGTIATGKPSWAKTAPLWGGAVGLAATLLVPPIRRRRRTPQPDGRKRPSITGIRRALTTPRTSPASMASSANTPIA
jgi:O-antigen ligase